MFRVRSIIYEQKQFIEKNLFIRKYECLAYLYICHKLVSTKEVNYMYKIK